MNKQSFPTPRQSKNTASTINQEDVCQHSSIKFISRKPDRKAPTTSFIKKKDQNGIPSTNELNQTFKTLKNSQNSKRLEEEIPNTNKMPRNNLSIQKNLQGSESYGSRSEMKFLSPKINRVSEMYFSNSTLPADDNYTLINKNPMTITSYESEKKTKFERKNRPKLHKKSSEYQLDSFQQGSVEQLSLISHNSKQNAVHVITSLKDLDTLNKSKLNQIQILRIKAECQRIQQKCSELETAMEKIIAENKKLKMIPVREVKTIVKKCENCDEKERLLKKQTEYLQALSKNKQKQWQLLKKKSISLERDLIGERQLTRVLSIELKQVKENVEIKSRELQKFEARLEELKLACNKQSNEVKYLMIENNILLRSKCEMEKLRNEKFKIFQEKQSLKERLVEYKDKMELLRKACLIERPSKVKAKSDPCKALIASRNSHHFKEDSFKSYNVNESYEDLFELSSECDHNAEGN